MSSSISPEQFAELVRRMRAIQQTYFELRRSKSTDAAVAALSQAKTLEAQVDQALIDMGHTPTHRKCPIDGCKKQIPRTWAMCPTHWRRVDNGLKVRIWEAYRKEPGSPLHLSALQAAVDQVNAQLQPQLFAKPENTERGKPR